MLGVEVLEGTLRLNTPLHIPQLNLDVGRVTQLEINHRVVDRAKKGTQVTDCRTLRQDVCSCISYVLCA